MSQEETLKKTSGKYVCYLLSVDGSALGWSDDLEELRALWSTLGKAIFYSEGLTAEQLRKMLPQPARVGSALLFLWKNNKLIEWDEAVMNAAMVAEITAPSIPGGKQKEE